MSNENTHAGSCFCGEVQFEISGQPAAMGYCHCESCRHWSAGPVNAFTLWKPEALRVTSGAASIGTYKKTPVSYRKWCRQCGGHLFTDHPTLGLVDIYAALLPRLQFEPGVHSGFGPLQVVQVSQPKSTGVSRSVTCPSSGLVSTPHSMP